MTWNPRQLAQQTGRTFVVTGATSGIGLETARDLVARGGHVVMAVRDRERADRIRAGWGGPGRTSVVELDLADLDSVAAAAKAVVESHDAVHALVCNAGVMGGPYMLSAQGFERQMATNHLGHAALVTGLWPLLDSAGGRVVMVSSIAARGGLLSASTTREELLDPGAAYDGQQAYRNSKQANLLFAVELHRRTGPAGSPVSAVAAHPGVSATSLFVKQLPPGGLRVLTPVTRAVSRVGLQSAAAGAAATLRALDHSTPSGAFVGPARFGQVRGRPELLEIYACATDAAVAARLFTLTEDALGAPLPV